MDTDTPRNFRDKSGRDWLLDLDYGHVIELKKLGIDFDILLENPDKFVDILMSSPQKLVQILAVICDEQREAFGLAPEDFGRGFNRETLDAASSALLAAIVFFFPRTSAGKVLIGKIPEMMRKLDEKMELHARSISFDEGLSTAAS